MDNSPVTTTETQAYSYLKGWTRPQEGMIVRGPYLILRVCMPPHSEPIYWAMKSNNKDWDFVGGFDTSESAVYACNADHSRTEWE